MHIALIGGGSGISNLLKTFQKETDIRLSAIISTSDSGGSTGILRQTYSVPALGDIRKNLSALGGGMGEWTEYRFKHGFLDEHPVGNIWLLSLIEQFWFQGWLDRAHKILGIRDHQIIPATVDNHDILVTLSNGEKILWEDHIISQTHLSHQIETIELTPRVSVTERAKKAILEADMVVVGPGTFYTSLIPCLLPEGMVSAFLETKAKTIFIANVANFPNGHCDEYTVDTYLSELNRLVGEIHFDHILVHQSDKDNAQTVLSGMYDPRKIYENLLLPPCDDPRQGKYDSIPRNVLKHDAEKVLQIIKSLL